MQAYQTGAAPRGGGRGWQRGGAVTPAAEITQGTPVVDPNPIGGLGGGFGGFGVGPSGFGGIPQFQRGLDPASAARFRAQIKRNQVLEARGLPPRQIGTPIPYARSVPHPPPGGWNIGGAVDSTEALMAERDRLQQQLQTADEAMAQEIMAQIMEINKELEMAAAPGMAGGGVASLRGWQGGGSVGRTGFAPSFYQSPFDQYGQAFGFKRGKVDPRVQTKAAQHVMRNYWGQPPGGG